MNGALVTRVASTFRSVWANRRVRREAAWVIFHKLAEFVIVFIALKLFTNLMGKEVYGEFSLALTAAALLGNVVIMPMQQAYLRYRQTAVSEGVARSARLSLLCWFTVATLAVAVLTAVFTKTAGRWLGLEALTVAGAGLVFAGNRWRVLGIELLDLLRRRRDCALQNLGFLATQAVLVAGTMYLGGASAANALLAYALAAAAFGAITVISMIRDVASQPAGLQSEIMRMTLIFGAPFGALLVCQWVQNFAERFILGYHLDFESVGLYVAAYQVCGIPYMLLHAVLRALVLPVAYQRAVNIADARQLWSADKMLLAATGIYATLGALALLVYLAAGPQLLQLLTSTKFALPTGTLLCIALARYMQCLGLLLQTFFAVHQKMGASLWFRAIAGLLVLPICWFGVKWYAISGAVGGVLITSIIYTAIVCGGPSGIIVLVRDARRGMRAATPAPGPAAVRKRGLE